MQKKNKTCDEISAQLVEWKQKYSAIQKLWNFDILLENCDSLLWIWKTYRKLRKIVI